MLDRRKYTDGEIKKIIKNITILIDTREQVNDHITGYFDKNKIHYESMALPSGDYSFAVEAMPELDITHKIYFYNDIVFERKNSLEELSGCFGQTRERFNNEWRKCKASYKYLIIERGSYEDILNSNYDTQLSSQSYIGSIHALNIKQNVQIVFMPNRNITPEYMFKTFQYYLQSLLK